MMDTCNIEDIKKMPKITDETKQYAVKYKFLNGNRVLGYGLYDVADDNGVVGYTSRLKFAYLVGKGHVKDCTGQVYKNIMIYRGKGIDKDNVPSVQTRVDTPKEKSEAAVKIESTVKLEGAVLNGTRVYKYILKDLRSGKYSLADKPQTVSLIRAKQVVNARAQQYKGKILIRSYKDNFNNYPNIQVDDLGSTNINDYMARLNNPETASIVDEVKTEPVVEPVVTKPENTETNNTVDNHNWSDPSELFADMGNKVATVVHSEVTVVDKDTVDLFNDGVARPITEGTKADSLFDTLGQSNGIDTSTESKEISSISDLEKLLENDPDQQEFLNNIDNYTFSDLK